MLFIDGFINQKTHQAERELEEAVASHSVAVAGLLQHLQAARESRETPNLSDVEARNILQGASEVQERYTRAVTMQNLSRASKYGRDKHWHN